MEDKKSYEGTAFIVGMGIAFLVIAFLNYIFAINISEAELLKFCMDKNIKRQECYIPKADKNISNGKENPTIK